MRVLRAQVMGMCGGVRRAIRMALAVKSPHEVTIRGDLVHNDQILEQLMRRGFRMVSESDRERIPSTPKVLIPAHGISRHEAWRLKAAGKQLIDATCPLVQWIHEAARALRMQGRFVIVIGKPGHVEVDGIVEDLGQCEVVSKPDDAVCYRSKRLGVLCQSTTSPDRAERIVGAIRAQNPGKDIRYVPTICPATRDRQAAVLSLLGQVDALVVVGGANSNNTFELVQLARSRGAPSFHIQTAADIVPDQFRLLDVVGLTAGASTPDEVIETVYARLISCANAEDNCPHRAERPGPVLPQASEPVFTKTAGI